MPQGALFCPGCGEKAADFTVAQSDMSPSHFNSGMTATSQPYTTMPTDEPGFPLAPSPLPDTGKRRSGRRGLVLVVIVALAVLLVGVTFESGTLSSGGVVGPLNTPSTPLTGQQLYSAYTTNQTQAVASYTNKTLYVQDSLDFGVGHDFGNNEYYSSIASGSVVLIWGNPSQVGQLFAGAVVLAKCSVEGLQASQNGGSGIALYLQGCDLLSVKSQTAASTASVANL
jgi:hypothetical protein